MLREVKNLHVHPRITPFRLTTTASGVTVNIGYGDITATRTGAGAGVITPRIPFSRNGMLFACSHNATGSYVFTTGAVGSGSSFQYSIVDIAGSGIEGTAEGFLFGWDSSDTNIVKQQRVSCPFTSPRITWGQIASAGTVSIGVGDFSVAKTTTGVYPVTFRRNFGQEPIVLAVPISTSGFSTTISAKTASGCTVSVVNAGGSAADNAFNIIVLGSDSRSDSGKNLNPLENSQRKPRIVAYQILNASGTPTISIGGTGTGTDIASITDNGAGDFSTFLSTPTLYPREPVYTAFTTSQRAQIRTVNATTGLGRILTKNAAGTNADVDGITNVFCIGSDDVGEY